MIDRRKEDVRCEPARLLGGGAADGTVPTPRGCRPALALPRGHVRHPLHHALHPHRTLPRQ